MKQKLAAWIQRMLDEPRTSQPPPMSVDDLLASAVLLNRKIRLSIRARKYPAPTTQV